MVLLYFFTSFQEDNLTLNFLLEEWLSNKFNFFGEVTFRFSISSWTNISNLCLSDFTLSTSVLNKNIALSFQLFWKCWHAVYLSILYSLVLCQYYYNFNTQLSSLIESSDLTFLQFFVWWWQIFFINLNIEVGYLCNFNSLNVAFCSVPLILNRNCILTFILLLLYLKYCPVLLF